MDNRRCNCEILGLPHECGRPVRGRGAHTPCPSEAAYRRELRHRAADPRAVVHDECRRAANEQHNRRVNRYAADVAEALDQGCIWPCQCPPVLPDLESTLAYAHGYTWVAGAGWVHE